MCRGKNGEIEFEVGRCTKVSLCGVRLYVQFTFPVHSSLFWRILAMFCLAFS